MLRFYRVRIRQYVTEEQERMDENISRINPCKFHGTLCAANDKPKECQFNDQ